MLRHGPLRNQVWLVYAVVLSAAMLCNAAARADGWSDIGTSNGRPAWVDATVERRLRLLHHPKNAQEFSFAMGLRIKLFEYGHHLPLSTEKESQVYLQELN